MEQVPKWTLVSSRRQSLYERVIQGGSQAVKRVSPVPQIAETKDGGRGCRRDADNEDGIAETSLPAQVSRGSKNEGVFAEPKTSGQAQQDPRSAIAREGP